MGAKCGSCTQTMQVKAEADGELPLVLLMCCSMHSPYPCPLVMFLCVAGGRGDAVVSWRSHCMCNGHSRMRSITKPRFACVCVCVCVSVCLSVSVSDCA